MSATLAACGFAATTLYSFGGWCVEAYRNRALRRQVDAFCDETWHSAEDRAEFAGRCAWHAASTALTVPPMVDDHLRENFIAGWREEEAREAAEAEMWNAGVRR